MFNIVVTLYIWSTFLILSSLSILIIFLIPLKVIFKFKKIVKGIEWIINKLVGAFNIIIRAGILIIYVGFFYNLANEKSIDLQIGIYGLALSLLSIIYERFIKFDKKVSVIVDEENSKLIIKNLSNYNMKISGIKVEEEKFYFDKNMTKDEEIKLTNISFNLQKVKKLYLSYNSIYEIPYNKKNNTKEILYMEIFVTPGKMPIEEKIKTSIKV